MIALSYVDQGPISAETGPAATLHHTVELARLADDLGLTRYWLAEHHGVRNMGVSAPEILIGHIASRTTSIRVGSGGIMLPNHAPLHVVEQFRTLEALHPGRIDLALGRSTGTGDSQTRDALLRTPDGLERFGDHLAQVLQIGGLREVGPPGRLLANPADVALPPVFVLGSSAGSAEAAARLGLGYAFFTVYQPPEAVVTALRRYRETFTPARPGDCPWAIAAARVWVGDDAEHAEALAASERRAVLDYRTGNPGPLLPMQEALALPLTDAQRAAAAGLDHRSDILGDVDTVARRIAELAASSGADEVMAISNIHDPAERRRALRRMAVAVGQAPAGV